jgi:non-heme chloroperoxidase
MRAIAFVCACTAVIVLAAVRAQGQSAAWTDPSPHVVRFVTVAPQVRIEVLDWGGAGPPLVFLAGAGNTAHVWDDFAPTFRDHFHVYGITRRGFGASSQPSDGYDTKTLARDVVAVLDSLRITRASFVAHSFGGSELNELGSQYPDRVALAVYLEAAFDFKKLYATPGWSDTPSPRPPPPTAADTVSNEAYTAWARRTWRWDYPEAEARAVVPSSPSAGPRLSPKELMLRLSDGAQPVNYAAIREPVLAIYAFPRSAAEMFRFGNLLDSAGRAIAVQRFAVWQRAMLPQHERFRREVPQAHVVEIPGADHYVFLSNTETVTRMMRAFLDSNGAVEDSAFRRTDDSVGGAPRNRTSKLSP